MAFSRSIGIDLSAAPRNTAVVELMWDGSTLEAVDIWGCGQTPVSDEELHRFLDRTDAKVGVDCPFGWPKEFVHLVAGERPGARGDLQAGTPDERRHLVYRTTDLDVMDRTKAATGRAVRPLSVSADRIAHVAFRFAGLRAQLRINKDAPRDGSGALVEVYPAAALALWGLDFRRYKGPGVEAMALRRRIVARLQEVYPVLAEHIDDLVASDHVLDAFVCALIARDADVDHAGSSLSEEQRQDASVEGWIHLPLTALPVG